METSGNLSENFRGVSVVTICYNAAKTLRLTLESVLAQDYNDFEYIIQDGASTDETASIIDEYKGKFQERNIPFYYYCEKDNGIYDAMNRGAAHSHGTWVNYMNAGDCFYNATVLSDIFTGKSYPSAAVLYGDCLVYEYGRFYFFGKHPDKIYEIMPFSHQSAFARRELLIRFPFRTEYKYSADYDFLLTVADREMHFADTGVIIGITEKEGLTAVNYKDTLLQTAEIQAMHNHPVQEKELTQIVRSLTIKQYVLDHFPVCIKKAIRGIQIKLRHEGFEAVIPPWMQQ